MEEPRSSQYYGYDHRPMSHGPRTSSKQSFSARAGQVAPMMNYDAQDSTYSQSQSYDPFPSGRVGSMPIRQSRVPQAAMHVPPVQIPSSSKPARYYANPRLEITTEPTRNDDSYFTSPTSPQAYCAVGVSRSGSVPERSPLQKLEGKLDDISKEEKRARMEEAEHRAKEKAAAADRSRRDAHARQSHAPGKRRSSGPERRSIDVAPERANSGRRNVSAPTEGLLDARRPEQGTIDFGGQPYKDERTAPAQDSPRDVQEEEASAGPQRFRRASEALRMHGNGYDGQDDDVRVPEHARHSTGPTTNEELQSRATNAARPTTYRHRSRDAGYVGAAAAAGQDARHDGAEEKDADSAQRSRSFLGRGNSKKLQKKKNVRDRSSEDNDSDRALESRQQLQTERMGATEGLKAAVSHQDPDPLPPSAVKLSRDHGPTYQVPPQTAGGQHAKEQVGFGRAQQVRAQPIDKQDRRHQTFDGILHGHHDQKAARPSAPALEEWRKASTARLSVQDLELDAGYGSRRERSTGLDGTREEEPTSFRPPLYLSCGPLLRYTGIRRERLARPGHNGVTDKDIWRGSVMIVTLDQHSSYERAPILRLFAQPVDLLPVQPQIANELPPGRADLLAGQAKSSRTGQALYVKPVDHLDHGVDLSRAEDDHGLYESVKSTPSASGTDGQQSRSRRKDGESAGRYREVKAARLHAERGVTFWRFNLEIELSSHQSRVAYRINRGPATGFWVPGRGQTMNIMFHSCNGFSLSVDSNLFSGPDPLWRDVLNAHQTKPFHVMLGGGDQIYNDAVMRDSSLFRDWLQTKNPQHKHGADFSSEMQEELESCYLNRYSMWFSQGLFGMANSQIPMVNVWDDHDIIDGFGSYPHHFMSTKVFTGLGAVAFKYYMLFQHQSVPAETYREEPSWLLGAAPGPYINELSRSVFLSLGRKVALLGLDCRTERMRDEIMSQASYDLIFNRCRAEIIKGETKHLIVLLGVPIAYPRLNFLENILTSKVMDPIKALGRTGMLGGFVNKFDGGVEILDDLDDHWTAKHHKQERNWFIQELQEIASEKSVRITILGGDVHLGAVGQFYSNKKLGVPKDQDHRYMTNIVSSAIVNTPPPPMMADILNRRNKVHHLDAETDEDMIPMFEYDVDGKPRGNHHLLPRRNYCTIREYHPGSTPPPTPRRAMEDSAGSQSQDQSDERRYPPGSMGRSRSLTRGAGNLMRRLSGSRSRNPPVSLNSRQQSNDGTQRRGSTGGNDDSRQSVDKGSYRTSGSYDTGRSSSAQRPSNAFQRRPTDMSGKEAARAAAKGGPDGNLDGREQGNIDLEHGLDICLNMEIDQHSPAGITAPYRLLVPALSYQGHEDVNTTRFRTRRASIMDRIRGRTQSKDVEPGGQEYSAGESESDDSRSPSPDTHFTPRAYGQRPPPLPSANTGLAATRQQDTWPRNNAIGYAARPQTNNQQSYQRRQGTDGAQDTYGYSKEYSSLPTTRHIANAAAPPNKDYGVPAAAAPTAPHPARTSMEQSRPTQPRQKSKGWLGFRRQSNQGQSQRRRSNEGYGRERYGAESDSEDSLTSSEDERVARPLPPSQPRPSKADRLLGIADEGGAAGGRPAGAGGGHEPEESRKSTWKIWKNDW